MFSLFQQNTNNIVNDQFINSLMTNWLIFRIIISTTQFILLLAT